MDQKTVKTIMNSLRQGTLIWHGRATAYRKASKKEFVRVGLKGQKIFKTHWQCAKCKRWYRNQTDLEVDHIKEIGGFRGDWQRIIEVMFDESNLQLLCTVCHLAKTKQYLNARDKWKRKPR